MFLNLESFIEKNLKDLKLHALFKPRNIWNISDI